MSSFVILLYMYNVYALNYNKSHVRFFFHINANPREVSNVKSYTVKEVDIFFSEFLLVSTILAILTCNICFKIYFNFFLNYLNNFLC